MPQPTPILIAIDDIAVHSEAVHLAAASGRAIVDATASPAVFERHIDAVFAVLVDAPKYLTELTRAQHRAGIFLVGPDLAAVAAAHAAYPAAEAAFVLPAQAAELLRCLGTLERTPRPLRAGGKVIAVVGAAGGVGASTLCASISRAAARDREPTIIDAHRYSGGFDLLVGIEERGGARWGEISFGEGSVERADVRRALPCTPDGIAVLTCSRTTIADPFVLDAAMLERTVAALGSAGLTVVDCPVGLVPQRCDLALVITPGEVRAAAAAARICAELAANSIGCAIVARRRSWTGLSISEIERVTKLDVVAEVPEITGLTRKVETAGLPLRLPRQLARAAAKVIAEVGV
ncbi:septum site-determining protein Ssd [Corynebacterium lipophiloflavum]|uniref:CpaE-like protein n=1 Tax=Corynebacterium lipophiloflavum (strain ATCC 700352 / DSM 44291 / CCUG 37336 / JCM 10383 / DMMZ 1944) TaxID=525263 RepID=C0XU82_CORLD|nr:septum site-determining protein Ssd [Corynebacterium lipophiloflavum]EEI16229.1 CpaE-like protein [Corynebacterium lipophiloflavum DSM 44291]